MIFKDFINNQYKEYAQYDNERSLPSMVDGLKTSARKVLYTASSVKEDKIKVVGLASRTTALTAYKHGEGSLEGVIVGLAQDFTGNNFPLLNAFGSFGNILAKSASSGRYIFTSLHENFNKLFHKDDMSFLEYLRDEGQVVEPKVYFPVLPILLLTGSSGIGNGFSTSILSYSEEQIKKEILSYLGGNPIERLIPYIKGYKGKIEKNPETKQVSIYGIIEKYNTTTLRITEIPIGYDLEKYKVILNKLVDDKVIKGYDNLSTEEGWLIEINCSRELTSKTNNELLAIFKLIQKETETIVCWDENDKIRSYDTIEELLGSWIDFRLTIYTKRKEYLIKSLDEKISWADNKIQFIELWNTTDMTKMGKKELESTIMSNIKDIDIEIVNKLLSMRITSLTLDYKNDLVKEYKALQKELDKTMKMTSISMMKSDIF